MLISSCALLQSSVLIVEAFSERGLHAPGGVLGNRALRLLELLALLALLDHHATAAGLGLGLPAATLAFLPWRVAWTSRRFCACCSPAGHITHRARDQAVLLASGTRRTCKRATACPHSQGESAVKIINTEALCAAPPEELAHSPSQEPNATEVPSCALISARAAQRRRRRRRWRSEEGARRPGPKGQALRHVLWRPPQRK